MRVQQRGQGPDYIIKLQPWSVPALLVAVLAVTAATGVRMIFVSVGVDCYFATFFPAVLLAGLAAGAPAAAFTALAAIPIVWWAFMPPVFEFSRLGPPDYDKFVLFLLSSSVMVWLSHLYREARLTLRKLDRAERL